MSFRHVWGPIATVAVILCGCGKPAASPPVPPTPAAYPQLPTRAQPRLPTIKLWLGAEELTAEMALNQQQEQTGMMFRTNMPENEAMIFVLPFPQRAAFWMMNCPLPLSVAYLDSDGVIQGIHKLEPFNTNNVVSATDNIRFAIETPQGWFDRHNVRTGAIVRTERGSLRETFLRQR
jgi:uncharacterized membrane protein (UPF0127 family)